MLLLLFCVIAFSLNQVKLVESNKYDCADYYWRDYYGTIPSDAIPAGKDATGNDLYIGLTYIRNYELLPATILPKQKVAKTTAYSYVLTSEKHVKILCSPFPEAFEWTSIHSQDLHLYTNRILISGGSEVGESLYIGRVYRDNGVIIGKIFRHERSNKGIWFPFSNSYHNSLTYEILSYNCDKADIPKFDVRAPFGSETNKTELAY